MLAFTSLAILGTTQDVTKNDISANPTGLMIVAIVAVVFCCLGAVILMFYNEKKVMKAIAKESDKEYLAAENLDENLNSEENTTQEVDKE
jgi:GPH family glycoside/pentoside/hexuronide:cation symporter